MLYEETASVELESYTPDKGSFTPDPTRHGLRFGTVPYTVPCGTRLHTVPDPVERTLRDTVGGDFLEVSVDFLLDEIFPY